MNGYNIVGGSFPLTMGNSTNGTTDQIGTYDLTVVVFSTYSGNGAIIVSDSNGTPYCVEVSGNTTITFPNIVVSNSGNIDVAISNVKCV